MISSRRVTPATEGWEGRGPTFILVSLIALAVVLRFWRLGDWNLDATEMFTLRDSFRPQFRNPRPLGYLLNYYLVLPFHPLDELGLRLVPALAGVLAVPAVYQVGRRLIGTRAALFAAFLVTVSALQVFYSQFARYWSLVFLFSAVYPYALYVGVRDRNRRAIALGLGTLVLAVLAHPVAILPAGGPALWLLGRYGRPRYLKQAWRHPAFRWAVGIGLVLAVAIAIRLVPILHGWISMHDRNPGMGQFLLAGKRPNGAKQAVLLLAYLQGLSLPMVLAAAAGLFLLWRERDRSLAVFLLTLVAFPVTFIALVSMRTPVSTFYLLPSAPAFYLAAGVLLDHLFRVDWQVRPQWLIPVTLVVALLLTDAPTLVSQYRNGRRFDFEGVAQWLKPRLSPDDVVVSDQPMVMAHYLGDQPVKKLRADTLPLAESLRELQSGRGGVLWIVAPAPAHAFRTTLKEGGLANWMYQRCQLSNTVGRGRLDFRQQYLQVFRCPPAAASSVR